MAARTLLDQMRREVQVALDEAARLAERIYPPLLESGGLKAALRAAAAAAGVRARIDVTGAAPRSPEIAGAVYFCWIGLLEHAGPDADASVELRSTDGELGFEVSLKGPGWESLTVRSTASATASRRSAVGSTSGRSRASVCSCPAGSRRRDEPNGSPRGRGSRP